MFTALQEAIATRTPRLKEETKIRERKSPQDRGIARPAGVVLEDSITIFNHGHDRPHTRGKLVFSMVMSVLVQLRKYTGTCLRSSRRRREKDKPHHDEETPQVTHARLSRRTRLRNAIQQLYHRRTRKLSEFLGSLRHKPPSRR